MTRPFLSLLASSRFLHSWASCSQVSAICCSCLRWSNGAVRAISRHSAAYWRYCSTFFKTFPLPRPIRCGDVWTSPPPFRRSRISSTRTSARHDLDCQSDWSAQETTARRRQSIDVFRLVESWGRICVNGALYAPFLSQAGARRRLSVTGAWAEPMIEAGCAYSCRKSTLIGHR